MSAKFPNSIWDGTSQTQPNPSVRRAPDRYDYDVATGEVIALETWLSERFQDVYDDLRISHFRVQGGADPTFTKVLDNGSGSKGLYVWAFAGASTDNELFFNCQIPHAWKVSTGIIHPHIHWFPLDNGAAGQKVKWGLEYALVAPGGILAANSTIITSNIHYPTDSTLVKHKHYVTDFPEISVASKESTQLICRVFRQASDTTNDTLAAAAGLFEFDFHYLSDKLGTKDEFPNLEEI